MYQRVYFHMNLYRYRYIYLLEYSYYGGNYLGDMRAYVLKYILSRLVILSSGIYIYMFIRINMRRFGIYVVDIFLMGWSSQMYIYFYYVWVIYSELIMLVILSACIFVLDLAMDKIPKLYYM